MMLYGEKTDLLITASNVIILIHYIWLVLETDDLLLKCIFLRILWCCLLAFKRLGHLCMSKIKETLRKY